ncbi:MAG: hypothetical protein IT535_04445 [Bauldia sp.]|nr:hypothetical protein [Bauldia sp.]
MIGDAEWRRFVKSFPPLAEARQSIEGIISEYLDRLGAERKAVRISVVAGRLSRMQAALERALKELEEPGRTAGERDATAWARERIGRELVSLAMRRAKRTARSVAAAVAASGRDHLSASLADERALPARVEQIMSDALASSIAHADLVGEAAFEAHLAPTYDFLAAISRAAHKIEESGSPHFQPGDAWLWMVRQLAEVAGPAGIKLTARKDARGKSPFVGLVEDVQASLPRHARRHASDAGLEHAVRTALRGRN